MSVTVKVEENTAGCGSRFITRCVLLGVVATSQQETADKTNGLYDTVAVVHRGRIHPYESFLLRMGLCSAQSVY